MSHATKSQNVDTPRRPRTATEYAYETLKSWVLAGRLAPGERVDQDAVALQLQISRMPVRSALDRLAVEGLVISQPHRGVVVTSLSSKDLEEIYLIRCALESLAVRHAVARAEPEVIKDLYLLVDKQEELANSDDLEALLAANREFHMKIYGLAALEQVMRILEGLWEQSERYRRIFLGSPGMLKSSTSDHRQLVDLIASTRADEAADFQVQHNQKTLSVLMAKISESDTEAPE